MFYSFWSRFWSLAGSASLRVKIMGILLLVVLTLGSTFVWFVSANMTSSLEEELKVRGMTLGNGLASQTGDLILTENLYAVYLAVRNALEADHGLRYIYILNEEGRLLVHSFKEGFPQDLLRVKNPQVEAAQAVIMDTGKERIMDVAVPILQGTVGTVHVGLSLDSIDATIGEQMRFVLLAIILVLVPGLLLGYLLATVIARALDAVVRTAEAVGQGDFTKRAPIWAGDEIGRLGAAFNNMTERLKLSHQQLTRRHWELSVLHSVTSATRNSLTVEATLLGALQKVCEQMETEKWHICLSNSDKGMLSFAYQHGSQPALVQQVYSAVLSVCPCVEALAANRYLEGGAPLGCPVMEGEDKKLSTAYYTTICLPLRAKGNLLGVVHLSKQDNLPFPPEDIDLLVRVAEQLSVAVENARLWKALKEREEIKGQLLNRIITAQEEERRRIAQELHDEAGQALTSVLVELRALELTQDREKLLARVEELRGLVANSLRGVQNIARELRPSVLDDVGLVAALRRYIQDYATRHSLAMDFQTIGIKELQLASPVDTVLYRIIQEALTNIARHADAHNVSVVLTRHNEDLIAIVEDDGKGFAVDKITARPEFSLGIRGMEERASLVGGRLTVESALGQGTTVFLEVPLRENEVAGGDQ